MSIENYFDFVDIIRTYSEMKILNWFGLIALIMGCVCFSLIAFKRSAWWGPAKSVMEDLDVFEKRFAIIGSICIIFAMALFLISNM